MLEFFEALFASLPPLTFRFHAIRQKPVIICTDASCSDEYAGTGAVATEVENDQRYISAAPIDKALRRVLAPNCAAPINCLEQLAVLCTMISSRDVIRSRTRGRTKTHTEILESVKVDQQSNQPPPFQTPSIGHLQDAQAARAAMANICSV